ncbi:hypothetical protein [Hydrogenimonas sp.]|uniref:hypothetical protein n=1 Tax=Hydrogenimonas sp. TaxID=2231112 RepID=UPI002618F88B|nr:hypothetical protein [Hydrogenimonas sp.]
MPSKILGYKELLKTLVEYHITFINRLSNEGYEKLFSILLIPLSGENEERIRELVLPLLRESDRLFYIEGKLIALLPGTDWNGALKVNETITEALGIEPLEECIVEYPADGENAFELIGNLYARYDEIRGE